MESKHQTKNIPIWSLILICVFTVSCNEGGASSGNDNDPVISTISPTSGPIGSSVLINGTNFSSSNNENQVSFNGTDAVVTSSSSESLETSVPSGATSGTVSITVNGEEAIGPVFTVEPNAPSITSVEPDSGQIGDEISILGINFDSFENTTVEFGNTQAPIISITSTEIIAEVPEGVDGGLVEVKVSDSDKTAIYPEFKIVTEGSEIAFIGVSGGNRHSCAIEVDGEAYCWGRNAEGQLGTGVTSSNKESPQPVRMLFGTRFEQISVGTNHTVALDRNGNVWTWGANNDGQLGDGTTQYSQFIKQVNFPESISFTKVDAGKRHTVALDVNGEVWAWGDNTNGRLGDSTEIDRFTPVKVKMPNGVVFSDVSAGAARTMALTASGDYWGWGFNGSGRLGNGDTEDKLIPVKGILPTDVTFEKLEAGSLHNLAIDNNGKLWAWGINGEGQLGDGTTTNRAEPTSVSISSGLTIESISAGEYFNLIKANDGSVWAWGDNKYGQIGIGTSDTDQLIPVMVQVPNNESFTTLGIGASHSLAISKKDELWSWGFNSTGQLGDSTQVNRSLPVKIKF